MLSEIAAAVRNRTIDPVDLVEEAFRRIDAANPAINAVVARDDTAALAAAKAHDRAGALAGIPVLIKDLVRVKGMRTSFGSPWFSDAPVDEFDDNVVARLRAAGAIVVGKSNTPSFGHNAVTENMVFGVTRNPWNLTRSPGGSSGGASAALAAGMVPLATSTDGGGSVRIPACFGGLVGYKPTTGSIGRSFGAPRWIAFSTHGATGYSVADVVTEAKVLFGSVPGDPMNVPEGTVSLSFDRPKRVLLFPTFTEGSPVDPLIADAFAEVGSVLSRLGYNVSDAPSPVGPDAAMQWLLIGAAELANSMRAYEDRWNETEPSLQQQLNFGSHVDVDTYITAHRTRYDVCAQLDMALANDAVFVTLTSQVQSYPAEGPLPLISHNDRILSPLNTAVMNLTGHPGVNVPLGIDSHGVPFGLQIVAPRWCDGMALEVAAAWERERPWPLVAPGYQPWSAADF